MLLFKTVYTFDTFTFPFFVFGLLDYFRGCKIQTSKIQMVLIDDNLC